MLARGSKFWLYKTGVQSRQLITDPDHCGGAMAVCVFVVQILQKHAFCCGSLFLVTLLSEEEIRCLFDDI